MRSFRKNGPIQIRNIRLFHLVILTALLAAGPVYSQDSGSDPQKKAAQQGKRRITGTVKSPTGEPLIGAAVQILNTRIGTITNAEGLYVIDVQDNDVLVFSYVTFLKQNVPVKGHNVLNVVLKPDETMLEEAVVVGYGKQKKGGVVSSISSVTSKQLTAPTSNLTGSLAGQLPGLIAIQRTGEPGRDNAEFWIRGISTFQGGTTPLVLVDGIPRDINNIEPDEIETFSLLKDAAATAVYGAEGANGVILVTTKRGTISKPRIAFRSEYSVSRPQRVPEFVDSWEYLELANEALFNDGFDRYKTPEEIEKYRSQEDNDLYPNTNWMDELLTDNVTNQRHTLNFRGGAENAKYFVSAAYFSQGGVFKKNPMGRYDSDFGFKRYNLRSNIDLKVSKTTDLNIDLSGQYINRQTANRSPDDVFAFMLNTPPHLFPAIYSDGTLATYSVQSDANNRNPFNMLYNQGYRKEFGTRIQSNVGIVQDLSMIMKGMSARAKFSLDYDGNSATLRDYWPSLYSATGRDSDGNLKFITAVSGSPELKDPAFTSTSSYRKIYVEGSLNYEALFNNRHNLGGMLLFMQKENQQHDVVLPFRKQSVVGRLTYAYENRYFIEGNFGYTGSEIFADGKRWGFFPAVGIAYSVSNEKFYPKALKSVLNTARVRLSYGRTGNDNVNTDQNVRFLYRATFKLDGPTFNQGIGSSGPTNGIGAGIRDLRFVNKDIHWEVEDKRNVGVDLGLFNSQIEITVDYFKNRRRDILMQRNTIPGMAGFHEKPWQNYGIVDNHGIDASLNSNQKAGDFKISTRGTFTFARNKIVETDELPVPYPWMTQTGTRINDPYVYIAERLYRDDDFIRTQNPNGTYSYELRPGLPVVTLPGTLGPGDIKFSDLNNDGKIDSYDRKRGVGHPYNPEINYGFGVNVDYKGFYVSAFFQGTANSSILLGSGNNTFWPFNWGIEKSNYETAWLDRWTADNPRQDAAMPRLHSGYAQSVNKEPNTWWLRNGNFLRFKNLEIGYSASKNLARKLSMQGARVYLMGYNLFVWDDFKLWDPELGNRNKGVSYPMSRTFTLGLELNL